MKFTEKLVPLILSGEKDVTWRLFDDKDLQTGDDCLFIEKETGKEFAKAKLTEVKETDFENLSKEEINNHDKHERSLAEMIKEFQRYYSEPIDEKTKIKVVSFSLID